MEGSGDTLCESGIGLIPKGGWVSQMKQGEKVDEIEELPAAMDLARDGLRSEKQVDVFTGARPH